MCIVAFAWQVFENMPLFLISNRDEFYHRPTQRLDYQAEYDIFAGRDLQSGGTWLGTNKIGKWAIITNYRDGRDKRTFQTSRGHIIQHYLTSDLSPMQFAKLLQNQQQHFAGFNLIIGNHQQAVYISNRGEAPQALAHGVYVLSNGLMSDDWAKTRHLRKRFTQELLPILQQHYPTMSNGIIHDDVLNLSFDLLQDHRQRDIDDLPDTGVGIEWEQLLSSTFIQSQNYGTRCSNVLMMTNTYLEWYEKIQHGDEQGLINAVKYELAYI